MTTPIPEEVGPPTANDLDESTLRLVEERLHLSKRRIGRGTVRIATVTDTVEEAVEVELDRYRVEVTRVPVGRVVDEAPLARSEGDTTIVPVVEERLVVVKQLVLKEELHIRHILQRDVVRETVPVRRQRAVVERRDAENGRTGRPLPGGQERDLAPRSRDREDVTALSSPSRPRG